MLMTSKERSARIDSVNRMKSIAYNKHCTLHKEADKLDAFVTLFEPPKTVGSAIKARAERVRAESWNLWDLYLTLDKVVDTLYARPHLYTACTGDTIVISGWLPNAEGSSTDEEEALQMLADYYEAKAAESVTETSEGEPF